MREFRHLRRGARATVVALALACASSRAGAAPGADDAVARAAKQFVEGQKAFTAGDYRRAGALFEGAYHDKPHHSALWNAARSWQKAGEEVRAANLYARFLLEAPANAPDRDQANAAVRDLATRMGRVELHGAPGVANLRLDGQPSDAPVIYVAAGEHLADAESSSGPVRKTVRVEPGQVVSVTLEPPEPEPAPREATTKPTAPPPDKGLRVMPPVVFVVGAGLTAVAGGLVVASGLDTVSKRDAFLDAPTQPNLDAGFSSQSRTNIAIGATAGIALVTAVIGVFFTDWSGASPSRAGARPGGAGWAF